MRQLRRLRVLSTPGGALGRKVTTAEADHCQTLTAIGSAGTAAKAPNRLQWVRTGLTLTTTDVYFDKVRSDRGHGAPRGGAGQRVGYTKTDLRVFTPESP